MERALAMVELPSPPLGVPPWRHPLWRAVAVTALALMLVACAGKPALLSESAEAAPTDVAPKPLTPQDEVLAVLDSLSAGQTVPLSNGGIARAEAAYDAASGRRCRKVEIAVGGVFENRLACKDKGVWGWYPFVLP